jgi:HSP20 family protein
MTMEDDMARLPSLFRAGIPASRDADPFLTLHREMNRLFDDIMGNLASSADAEGGVFAPRLDMTETDDEVVVCAELPGVDRKDVDVTMSGDVLSIRGEKKIERDERKENRHVSERVYGTFARSVQLPFRADPDGVSASFEHGVLTVHVPKPAGIRQEARRIEIGTAQTGGDRQPKR